MREKYISGQKGYEKADTVLEIAEEMDKNTKHGTHRYITNLFDENIKDKKISTPNL